MHDQVTYSHARLSCLVRAGFYKSSPLSAKGRVWIDVDTAWADIRAQIERSGDVESEAWLEVLDLETAIVALKKDHPEAAAVMALRAFGFDRHDCRFIRNFDRLDAKGRDFLLAWLNGDDAEAAYRGRRSSPRRVA